MRIIFLDIDGVLNSSEYYKSLDYLKETNGMSDAELMLVAHHTHLDPKALFLMNELVDRSGAEVVLSSTWRGMYSPEEMTEMMQKRGATFRIVASTPILFGKVNSSRIPRAKEIKAYLKALQSQPESFVILDDHDDMFDLKTKLIQTNDKIGLTQEDIENSIKILEDVPLTKKV